MSDLERELLELRDSRETPRHQRIDSSHGCLQDFGRLMLGQALAVAQNDSCALSGRQPLKGVKKLVASIDPTQLAVILRIGLLLAPRKGSFSLQTTEVVFG